MSNYATELLGEEVERLRSITNMEYLLDYSSYDGVQLIRIDTDGACVDVLNTGYISRQVLFVLVTVYIEGISLGRTLNLSSEEQS